LPCAAAHFAAAAERVYRGSFPARSVAVGGAFAADVGRGAAVVDGGEDGIVDVDAFDAAVTGTIGEPMAVGSARATAGACETAAAVADGAPPATMTRDAAAPAASAPARR
jgi:hypothetical protein